MPKRHRQRKCRSCRELFLPRPSTRHHQTHCSKPGCQRARKAKNNQGWRKRNADYFKDPIHAERTKAWRNENPRYWRREKRNGGPGRTTVPVGPRSCDALQAVSVPEHIEEQLDSLELKVTALQAVCERQQLTFQGFATQLTGTALQAEIGLVLSSWYDKGSGPGVVSRAEAPVDPREAGGEYETAETTVSSRAPS